MRFRFVFLLLTLIVLTVAALPASAEPSNGACFYKDEYFKGSSFCINAGESRVSLPPGFTDEISSIKIYGRAVVLVYEGQNLRDHTQQFNNDVADLRQVRLQGSDHTWNNRISSIRVDAGRGGWGSGDWNRGHNGNHDRNRDNHRDDDYRGGPNGRNFPTWGRGPQPNRGACFYRDRDFRGDYFCMRSGEEFRSLPSMRDDISSIRVFGGARVSVFDGSDFRGSAARFRRVIGDLRDKSVRNEGSHTWNNRISSIQVD